MHKGVMIDHKNNDNLRNSYRVGIFGCMMNGFVLDYFTPFLILIGGTTFHIGILSSLTNLFSSISQLPSAFLSRKYRSRKKVVLFFIVLQASVLFLLILFAAQSGVHANILIALAVCFTAFGSITHPGWISILSDLVSNERRGAYFGWRARNLGFLSITAAFSAGIILYYFSGINSFYGFAVIFGLGCLSRVASFFMVLKIKEPSLAFTKEHDFSLWQFLKKMRQSNFARFVLFTASVNFCVNLAAPFFSVLMLKDLSFNYFIFTVINIAAPITLYSVIKRWGVHADRVGNLKILKFVAPLFGFIPLLWIFNQHPVYLMTAEMVSGFLWAGFNLCSSNFIIDSATPEKRTRCIAYFNVINGLALALGAITGGVLLHFVPPLHGYKILSLFLISSVLRVIVGLAMPISVKEVRPVERVSSQQLLFSMIGVRPIVGIESKVVQV